MAETELRSGPENLIWVMPAEGVARETFHPRHRAVRRRPGPAATVPSQARPARDSVTVALDWSPNTNHTGIYVARSSGTTRRPASTSRSCPTPTPRPRRWSATARPTSASPTRPAWPSRAPPAPTSRRCSPCSSTPRSRSACRADRTDIKTPKDLDGKTYAGFGTPDETPLLQTVIRNAGGTGRLQERHAQHVGVRRRLPGQGRLHAAARNLGGHPGQARGQAAEDVQAGALRRAARVLGADRVEQQVPATAIPASRAASWPRRRAAISTPPTSRGPAARILIAANKQVLKQPQLVYESAEPDGQELLQGRRGQGRHADAGRLEGLRAASSSRPAC